MAEVTTSRSGTQTMVAGILVILWLTAIFIIFVLNNIQNELELLNSRMMSMIQITQNANPESLRVVEVEDPANPNVVYQFERILPEFEPELDEFGNPILPPDMAPVPDAGDTGVAPGAAAPAAPTTQPAAE